MSVVAELSTVKIKVSLTHASMSLQVKRHLTELKLISELIFPGAGNRYRMQQLQQRDWIE